MIFLALLLLQVAAPVGQTPRSMMQTSTAADDAIKEFDGVWLDIFEGQQFVAGAQAAPERIVPSRLPWLSIDRLATLHALLPAALAAERIRDIYTPHAYRIRFLGKRDPVRDCRPDLHSSPPRMPPPGCIGIDGSMPGSITVERVLSLQDLGPLSH